MITFRGQLTPTVQSKISLDDIEVAHLAFHALSVPQAWIEPDVKQICCLETNLCCKYMQPLQLTVDVLFGLCQANRRHFGHIKSKYLSTQDYLYQVCADSRTGDCPKLN
jgi:hypothetical protein